MAQVGQDAKAGVHEGGRANSAVRGIVYAALAITTVALVSGSAKGGSAGQNQILTDKNEKFLKYLSSDMTATARDALVKLGMVGTAFRGFVLAPAGLPRGPTSSIPAEHSIALLLPRGLKPGRP